MILTTYLVLLFFSVAKLGIGSAVTMKRLIGISLMTVALCFIYMESTIVKKEDETERVPTPES